MNLLIKSFLLFVVIVLTLFLFVWSTDSNNGLISDFINNEESSEVHGDDDVEEKVLIVDGYKAIQLDEQIISVSGLEFSQLKEVSFKPEFIAHAEAHKY